jgi:hypothetical protein
VTPEELERLRRSVVILPADHEAGALTKEAAQALLEEVTALRAETDRYRDVVTQLRRLLDEVESR